MNKERLKAFGQFLAFYYTDLQYIKTFQNFKHGKISPGHYLQKTDGSLSSFLAEFRVARNVDKKHITRLPHLLLQWVNSNEADNVDLFALFLRSEGVTWHKTMTSLASKLLFLNNPSTIFPMDELARTAVGLKKKQLSRVFQYS